MVRSAANRRPLALDNNQRGASKGARASCPRSSYQASQRAIRRIRTSVVNTHHGIITTSTLNLRTASMSLSTFGSLSKNRCRLRKMYQPPNKLTMKKNVAAIRSAGRTTGLICASICIIYVHFRSGSHSGLLEPRGARTVRNAPGVRDITTWSVIP